jgi:O-acetyl-ADP-ribose deacetylase (regulator of RNase III)
MARQERTPNMTEGRALLLGLMRRYLAAVMDPTVTLLEIHKLMYFMQEGGQDLRLNYAKGPYGPYAENLRHVLTHIEGHFIVGYGDAADNPEKPIAPKAEALAAAEDFLRNHPTARDRYARVGTLISGFETPYGMELLSTLHWVARHEGATDFAAAVEKTYAWANRKRMFGRKQLQVAWDALQRGGWMGPVRG